MSNREEQFFARADALLQRLERLLPAAEAEADLGRGTAYRWRRRGAAGFLQPIRHRASVRLEDLQCIDRQKALIDRNTRQFLAGLPANNVLLWGPRGTGKSSLIKALLNAHAGAGLRLIEVDKHELTDLPEIVDRIDGRPERYVVFCDDLSFEENDASYKSLKVALDGSLSATPDNLLIYATSNRRHLLPERLRDNLEARTIDGEIHHGEAVEERVSLSERFGLWLAFHPFSQDQYLSIVAHWLAQLGVAIQSPEVLRQAALQWALLHGSRSGRSAWQFARDWAGRSALEAADRQGPLPHG